MRTDATSHLNFAQTLNQLDNLKFSVSAIAQQLPKGSYESELAMLAVDGVKKRIDYIHDCLTVEHDRLVAKELATRISK